MKKLIFISALVMVIGTCFTGSTFAADFYVIPIKKDSDLVPENIACDIEILGVTGTLVYDGIACDPIVPKTEQTDCWTDSGGETDCARTGQDGEYQLGITPAVAPSSLSPYTVPNWGGDRFTDNNDGTVTDNLTGLIWLKQANYINTSGETVSDTTWNEALNFCNTLQSGQCGLTDGSSAGDWRLPNLNELRSLVEPEKYSPALPSNHPFTGVIGTDYISSTTHEDQHYIAWYVNMSSGSADSFYDKAVPVYRVWPVRGGN